MTNTSDRRERYATAIHDAMETDLSLADQEPAYQALIARAAEAAEALADAEQNRQFLTTLANLGIATHRLDRIRDAARLHRQQLLGTSELYAVIEADDEPEQCPRSEFDGYGLQCQKPAGHNLCTFEEQPAAVSAAVSPPTNPTHGLSVPHANALWDAIAIPGPHTPTYPEQHERVCRAVRDILDELTPARDEEADQTALRDRIADKLTAAAYECDGKCGLSERECYDAHPITFSAMAGGTTHVDGSVTAIADAVLAVLPSAADWDALVREADRLRRDGAALHARAEELDTQLAALRQQVTKPADRAAVLADVERAIRAATRSCGYKAEDGCDFCNGVDAALDQVRRMADETATETQARRGDAFEQWLKARRDEWAPEGCQPWQILDQTLEEYRLHADTGTPLGEHVCEGKAVGDCECLEQPAAGARQDETPDAQTQPATPMTAHLTTPCDACDHTLNWHSSGETGCTVLRCACARYYHAAGQGQDGNQP